MSEEPTNSPPIDWSRLDEQSAEQIRSRSQYRRLIAGARIDADGLPSLPPPEYPELWAEVPTWVLRAWSHQDLVGQQDEAIWDELRRRGRAE